MACSGWRVGGSDTNALAYILRHSIGIKPIAEPAFQFDQQNQPKQHHEKIYCDTVTKEV